MVSLEEAVIARLELHGSRFEVLVDPDLALEFKKGKRADLTDVLAIDTVFKDSKKGDKASEEHLKEIFGTDDDIEVAKEIIRKGEIQLTTEQRRRMQEDRKRQVITFIARHGINPQTGAPHPPQRIERAMDEAKVHIDLFKDAEEQVPKILQAIRPLIPIRFEERTIAVKIPAHYAGKAHSVVKEFGEVKKEEWQMDGSLIVLMEVPAGSVEDFFDELNKLTKGEVETRILGK
ncbi:MAG: ribosome assembly factor SBDS [Candidatus Hydrothermarchaeales archaeon]